MTTRNQPGQTNTGRPMIRSLLCLPLLGLAPLGHFLGFYLEGAGFLPRGVGFCFSAASVFVLPWVVSAFIVLPRFKGAIRIVLFVCVLVAQGVLLFTIVPPGVTCEMMGIAYRFRRELPPDQLRACADNLRQKLRDGTLVVSDRGEYDGFPASMTAKIVADAELPVSLRGRFQRVFIQQDPVTGDEQVIFALERLKGIICDRRKHVKEFFVYSMAPGVHAYRYQRI
jgi:hypothetical protein